MNHVLLLRKGNFSTLQNSDVPAVWFLENKIVKNWTDVVLHHMLDSKRKKIILPDINYEFREEEPDIVHTKGRI